MANLKGSWYGPDLWAKVLLIVAQLWMFVSIGVQIMVLTVWVMIFIQNIDVFDNVNDKYMGNDGDRYDMLDGNVGSGYVGERAYIVAGTNMPKQLGGAVFSSMFAVAMWIFILISLAADVAWRYPQVQRFLTVFHTTGLWNEGDLDTLDYFFLWANAGLKVFIGVTTGSTSWRGLQPNNRSVDTEVFALYATFIYLVNIIPAYVANQLCISVLKQAAWPEIFAKRKADIESAASASAHAAGKKEAEEAAAAAAKAKAKSRERSAPKA